MNIIELLYNGELNPFETPYTPSKEFLSAFRTVENTEKKLLTSLSEEHLTNFKQYISASNAINDTNNFESFSTGFRLGAQLMIDILIPPDTQ